MWSRHGATCRTKAVDGRASLHAVAVVAGESSHGRHGTTTTTTLCGTTCCSSRRTPRRLGALGNFHSENCRSENFHPGSFHSGNFSPETSIPERATLKFSGRLGAHSPLSWGRRWRSARGLSGAHPLLPAAGGLRHVARRVGTNHVHSAGTAPPRHSYPCTTGWTVTCAPCCAGPGRAIHVFACRASSSMHPAMSKRRRVGGRIPP